MRIPALRLVPLAAIGGALALVIGLIAAQAGGASADSFAVDLDISGNTATTLGTTDECVEVTAGGAVTFDVVATNIPASNPAALGFAFILTYDGSHFSITAADGSQLLNSTPGSSVLLAGDEAALPDTDGEFSASVADTAPGASESGSGVLERLTMTVDAATPAGGYPLTLSEAAHIDPQNKARIPDELFGARLAVGVTCESLPTPTAAPSNAKGDVDCTGAVNAVDSLKLLRTVAGLSVTQTEPCDNIGTGSPMQGDINCDLSISALDALFVLRFVAQLNVNLPGGCAVIGS